MTPTPPHRPLVHYTPPQGWLNDPNGLVFLDGEFHLFYQHHPHSPDVGPMHWGHAVSADLTIWDDLPIALEPDAHGVIYSGSAVVDAANTAGFGDGALVVVFTHFTTSSQSQSVAWSMDRGRTWELHADNPMLRQPPGITDFRDPRVFWFDARDGGHWVMVLSAGDRAHIYNSLDLRTWELASVFAPERDLPHGVWEMPDLFPLSAPEASGPQWVLAAGVSERGPAGGSGTRYWVGEFDGLTFIPEMPGGPRWVDHGADFYAAQTWSGVPDGRRVWIAWMSNWAYAAHVPAAGRRGQMTLPRELRLEHDRDAFVLAQRPAAELTDHLGPAVEPGSHPLMLDTGAAWIRLGVRSSKVGTANVELRAGDARVRVGYDAAADSLTLDRTRAAAEIVGDAFAAAQRVPVAPRDGRVDIDIVVDRSSVEVFAQHGQVCLTDLVLGLDGSQAVSVTADGELVDHFDVRHFDVRRAGGRH